MMRLMMMGAVALMAAGCDELLDDNTDGEGVIGTTLEICDSSAPDDAVWIDDAQLSGDTLTLEVSFGGGCEAHSLQLCWDGAIMDSYPMQANIWLSHDANGDTCEALLGEVMEIDISSIGASPTSLHLDGWEGELLYE